MSGSSPAVAAGQGGCAEGRSLRVRRDVFGEGPARTQRADATTQCAVGQQRDDTIADLCEYRFSERREQLRMFSGHRRSCAALRDRGPRQLQQAVAFAGIELTGR